VGEIESHAGDRPLEVVAALPLSRRSRERLAEQLGPGFHLVDIRRCGDSADVVLAPQCSPQTIGRLTGMFPGARVVVIELQDWAHGIDIPGPVSRALDAGAAAYYVAPSAAALGEFLRGLPEPERGEGPASEPPSLTTAPVDALVIEHLTEAMARREARRSP
jgi:hypothetical protein